MNEPHNVATTELVLTIKTIDETEELASCLAQGLQSQLDHASSIVISLDGMLGAGKTTLIRMVCKHLGVDLDQVSSPTFALQNVYEVNDRTNLRINHFDFYRIKDEDELFETGYEETICEAGLHFIEWANRFPAAVPDENLQIEIGCKDEDMRLVTCRYKSAKFISCLKECLCRRQE